jgi:hypothetical protein
MLSSNMRKRFIELLAKTTAILMVIVFFQASGFAITQKKQAADSIEEKWGIKIGAIRLTARDYMLDFRYRVKDPDKAAPILRRGQEAFLIDQATGKKLPVPTTKVGPMRSTTVQPKADRQYVVLFSNLNKIVKRGNKVTVVIGDFKAENLTVE